MSFLYWFIPIYIIFFIVAIYHEKRMRAVLKMTQEEAKYYAALVKAADNWLATAPSLYQDDWRKIRATHFYLYYPSILDKVFSGKEKKKLQEQYKKSCDLYRSGGLLEKNH